MWIRNIVIRKRVEDLQLGIESYQIKLNLEQPNWDASDFLFKEDYTIVNKPRAVIYRDRDDNKKMMRIDEDNLKMEMEMEIPSVKASASAQDGDPLHDDVRLCLGDDLKKAQDHNQRQVKDESKDHYPKLSSFVKSIKSCFGGMMVNFGFFDGVEMEAFGEAMEVDNG
ncbi:hypothetical protein Tco_0611727 [Tanacetum coccineum]